MQVKISLILTYQVIKSKIGKSHTFNAGGSVNCQNLLEEKFDRILKSKYGL